MFPSVTEVLSPWADFSKIPPDVLAHAAARGTAVHDACAAYASGVFVVRNNEEITGYLDSFVRWFELMVDEVLLVEPRLVDTDFGFHGEEDLVVRSKHSEIILVDLKTPVQLLKSWRLQLSAYNHLVIKHGIRTDRVGSLQLDPNGKIAKMTYYDSSLNDFNLFLQCLNLCRFFGKE